MKLVPIDKDIAEFNYLWRQEEASKKYNPFQGASFEELWKRNKLEGSDLSDFESYDVFRKFAVVDGNPVGNVSVKTINRQMMTAEIGYLVGEDYYRKGYGTQMVSLFLTEVFEKTKLRRLEAVINVENQASCSLVEKLGFQNEGRLRAHYILNGEPTDNYMYGLLREEFKPV